MFMTRKEVFDQIWVLTVQGFAEAYELNYARLLKLLKTAEIPKPTRREILFIRQGEKGLRSVEKPELPGDPEEEIELPRRRDAELLPGEREERMVRRKELREEKKQREAGFQDYVDHPRWSTLYFLAPSERCRVIEAIDRMQLRTEGTMHPKVMQIRKELNAWHAQLEIVGDEELVRQVLEKPSIAEKVSVECLDRALVILDCLYTTVEELGGAILENGSVLLHDQEVTLQFSESRARERQKMHYTGKLSLSIGFLYSLRDRKKDRIEDRLGDILELLYLTAFQLSQTGAREETHPEKDRESFQLELERTENLIQQARDHEDAARIRDLIMAVQRKLAREDLHFEDNFPDWAAWASEKADWLDPTVGREDPLLGRRHAPILEPPAKES